MTPLEQWFRLCGGLGFRSAAPGAYEALARQYETPPRAYHNLDHVAHCLAEFESLRDSAEHPEAVEAAIWFHDAIYDPRAADNETGSAEFARQLLARMGLDHVADELEAKGKLGA